MNSAASKKCVLKKKGHKTSSIVLLLIIIDNKAGWKSIKLDNTYIHKCGISWRRAWVSPD